MVLGSAEQRVNLHKQGALLRTKKPIYRVLWQPGRLPRRLVAYTLRASSSAVMLPGSAEQRVNLYVQMAMAGGVGL